ncbi:MAG: type II toxin-antitoxin system PemK/MazF family toxin [Candidatus Pacebacteria bacterium]|nr:type II toxin-antitoxin system PemK/MazF family toxin [Candidatus Paceibacterota bacterium]
MKNFRDWFKLKTKINNGNKIIYFHERELWWINLGVNVGSEQDGVGYKFLRPVVIIKKFNKKIFWGIPLTTKDKKGLFYYHFNFKNKKEIAEISQLKLIDSKRLVTKMGTLDKDNFDKIKKITRDFLE